MAVYQREHSDDDEECSDPHGPHQFSRRLIALADSQ